MPGIVSPSESNSPPEAQVQSGLLAYHRLARQVWSTALDLLFPPRCAGCGRVDAHWCLDCQRDLVQTPLAVQIRYLDDQFMVVSSGAHSGILREAVQGLKYSDTRLLAQPLGERLAAALTTQKWTFGMIVPVPLHTKRLTERGYNQAQLLAESVASRLATPCVPSAIIRQRYTSSQVGLGAMERRMNVDNAFLANPDLVANQSVLLVDDVCTTGATIAACAHAALEAGAHAVYGMTVTATQVNN